MYTLGMGIKCLPYIDGLVQNCSNSIANALELLQPCTKSSKLNALGVWTHNLERNIVDTFHVCN